MDTGMVKKLYYVCGRCGYRAHHMMKCHNCGIMLEEECKRCYSARGNCVCMLHGVHIIKRKAGKAAAAVKKRKRR